MKQRRRMLAIWRVSLVLAIILAILPGEAIIRETRAAAAQSPIEPLAILGFNAPGVERNAILELEGILINQLQAANRFQLLLPQMVAKKLGTSAYFDCINPRCLTMLGDELGVSKLIAGEIGKKGDKIRLSLTMLEVKQARISSEGSVECVCPLAKLKENVRRLTIKLLEDTPLRGQVVNVRGETVEISLGANGGLREGDVLSLFRLKDVMAGRRKLYTGIKEVGDVRVTQLSQDSAEGKVLRQNVSPAKGDLFEVKAPKVAPVDIKTKGGIFSSLSLSKLLGLAINDEPLAPPAIENTPPIASKQTLVLAPTPTAPAPPPPPPSSPAKAENPANKPTPPASGNPSSPEPASLKFITNPAGATITIDGEKVGKTPKIIPALNPGKHKVKLAKWFYTAWSSQLELKPGQYREIKVNLVQNAGFIKISSSPGGAKVFLRGKSRGNTDLTLKLVPGKYTFALVKKGFAKRTAKVQITNGQTSKLAVILNKKGTAIIPGMLYVPEGEFTMGSEEGDTDERPVHKIYLADYYIDMYEVSNAEYKKFIEAMGSRGFLSWDAQKRSNLPERPAFWDDNDLNSPDLPVVGVPWKDAAAYCGWVEKRLPTEAEWEKAARGIDKRNFPWGNSFEAKLANASGRQDGFMFTAPVSSFPGGKSPYGGHNMAGNVWEWCADWYDPEYYGSSPKDNPKGPETGSYKVIRGGSWEDQPDKLRTSNRYADRPSQTTYNLGFRCAK